MTKEKNSCPSSKNNKVVVEQYHQTEKTKMGNRKNFLATGRKFMSQEKFPVTGRVNLSYVKAIKLFSFQNLIHKYLRQDSLSAEETSAG